MTKRYYEPTREERAKIYEQNIKDLRDFVEGRSSGRKDWHKQVLLNLLDPNQTRHLDQTKLDQLNNFLKNPKIWELFEVISSDELNNFLYRLRQLRFNKFFLRGAREYPRIAASLSKSFRSALIDLGINSKILSNILNNIAQLGFSKNELNINASDLRDPINRNLNSASAISIANILNGAAQLGFYKDELGIDIKILRAVINRSIESASAIGLANTFNGLMNLGLLDKKFVKEIRSFISNEKKQRVLDEENTLSDESSINFSFSVARVEFYCQKVLGEKLFGKSFLKSISKRSNSQIHSPTSLEIEFISMLSENNFSYDVEQEQYYKDVPILITDLVVKKDGVTY
ncbi:MAG: hypothetical protein SFV53_05530 [Rickettsiales bacterium]|nr:hypothetical protein [Rickettsiales bacterium]